jgi:hypothetical protein
MQAHFIKTVADIAEVLSTTLPKDSRYDVARGIRVVGRWGRTLPFPAWIHLMAPPFRVSGGERREPR